jgi:membrane dipeptidase
MRLIDLHVDWLLQYAAESTVFDPADFPDIAHWIGQAEGYLGATSAAILACYRTDADWARRADSWPGLIELIARVEAEFSGRVLRDPEDIPRWNDDPDGLAWAVIGVEGFDRLVRDESDLARLPGLVRRGVRLFQPTYTTSSLLAGSSGEGDDRGLLDLGRGFLEALAEAADGVHPIVDLAHLNPRASDDVLAWFEADAERTRRLGLAYSHGAVAHPGYPQRSLSAEGLARLRALGGFLGLTPAFFDSADAFRGALESAAAVPFLGRAGYEGICMGTDLLGVDDNPAGLGNAPEVAAWAEATFTPDIAAALVHGNARRLIERAVGATGWQGGGIVR